MHPVPNKRQQSKFLQFILPGIYLMGVLVADYNIPIGTITPFFVVLGLLYMAVTMRPRVMIPWAIVYTVTVSSIFLSPKLFTLFSGHSYYDQYVIPLIRSSTYLLVGTSACYICVLLSRLRKSENELELILSCIPWPLLTSDINGRIIYWNDASKNLIPELNVNNVLQSYFSLLAPPGKHGKTIAEYIRRFNDEHLSEPLELMVRDTPHKGYTERINWTGKSILLTIIMDLESTAPPQLIQRNQQLPNV